ncbi:hypothetical protein A45J_1868 [hot springs metagenome]|uniref:Uncharacterized protein n=1 Tax=hot springs metagenome TaxID=433727 RepID=A0A5J4L5F3_9ZZZZ
MIAPIAKEKIPNICHRVRYANKADKDRPAIKMIEAIS